MDPQKSERPPKEFLVPGTNPERVHLAHQKWKAQRKTRMAWSTVAAVGVHVVAFVVALNWVIPPPQFEAELEPLDMAWISLFQAPASGLGASPGAPPVAVVADSTASDPDVGEGGDSGYVDEADLAQLLRLRLLRRGVPEPTIVEPEPEAEAESARADDADGTGPQSPRIGGDASTAALAGLPEATSLDLARLSSLRPDIALAGASAWVLVLNAGEVLRFMRESFGRESLGPGVRDAVSVVLFIDERGSVEWAEISESSGMGNVDDIVLQLFNEIVAFRPARNDGVPVPRSAIFTIPLPW